jgi:hypothetical protein
MSIGVVRWRDGGGACILACHPSLDILLLRRRENVKPRTIERMIRASRETCNAGRAFLRTGISLEWISIHRWARVATADL